MFAAYRPKPFVLGVVVAASLQWVAAGEVVAQTEDIEARLARLHEEWGTGEPMPVESAGFGLGFQKTAISAAAFRPANVNTATSGYDWNAPQGHILQTSLSLPVQRFVAPLILPNGAIIESICLISEDLDNNGQNALTLTVTEFDLAPQDVGLAGVLTGEAEQPGWLGLCANDLGISYRSRADFNGNDVIGDVMYTLEADMTTGNTVKKFGGAIVLWRRTVSSPPGAATFDDVPPSHRFFSSIEALVASGVTLGCGSGDDFCPGDPLTRGQMASFLAKALGLHWPD